MPQWGEIGSYPKNRKKIHCTSLGKDLARCSYRRLFHESTTLITTIRVLFYFLERIFVKLVIAVKKA